MSIRFRRGRLEPVAGDPTPTRTVGRDRIVAAARQLYGSAGFTQTSTHDVALVAGTGIDEVDRLFPDPADLFAAVYHQVQDEVGARIAASYADDDPVKLMRAGIDTWVDSCKSREVRRILVTDAPVALGWERWHAEGDQYGRVLIDTVLADAMERGVIPEQPVRPLAFTLAGALESGVQYAVREPDVGGALEQVRGSLHLLLDGLVRS